MKFRKKPVIIEATQWFKNGDHPLDYSKTHDGFAGGELVQFSPEYRKQMQWEGDIVRYYRTPDVDGQTVCKHCGDIMHNHGWIDTLEGGHIVCPGDWIITGVKGEHYPCKPDIFGATYEPAEPEPVKTQWCYSVNEENFYGGSDTEQEAHGEAQYRLHNDMEVGDTGKYWIAKTKPAEEFLRPDMVGESVAEQIDEWLAEDIGWDDRIVELSHAEATELGNLIIQYIRKANGFRVYGITDSKEHTYTKEEE